MLHLKDKFLGLFHAVHGQPLTWILSAGEFVHFVAPISALGSASNRPTKLARVADYSRVVGNPATATCLPALLNCVTTTPKLIATTPTGLAPTSTHCTSAYPLAAIKKEPSPVSLSVGAEN